MKKNDKISTIEINGVKASTVHAMVQDINSAYPHSYTMNGYKEMTEEIHKSLEDMTIFYTGMIHFGGYYGEDGIFYLAFIDNIHETEGYHQFSSKEIIEAYYNAGSPENINIEYFIK